MNSARQIIDEFTAAAGIPSVDMGPTPLVAPTTKPGTKPARPATPAPSRPSKPGVRPWKPTHRPGVNPRPKAGKTDEEPWGASL